jgi:NDP-sugar pyrophosphorylase family protein
MKALILAGGFGTRLRPLSCTRPKTLFPIINKPLLQWIFERLAKNNITEVILAVNQHTALYIKQQRIPKYGLTVKYSHDPTRMPLGTGGPIKKAEKLIGHAESFLVINGDIFTELNYKKLLETHNKIHRETTQRNSPKQPHKRRNLRPKPKSFPVYPSRKGGFNGTRNLPQTSPRRHTLRTRYQGHVD